MKYLIGRKEGMTQVFLNDGTAVPVTVVQAGPCKVTAVKTKERDGYDAVQLGYGERKKLSKPEQGHLKDLPQYAHLHEFPQTEQPLEKGTELTVAQFATGDDIKVTGVSKGKGFQGVVKRHGFGGSLKTHGHKDQLRMPGSIGSTGPQRVFKNMRMAGHMGHEQVTTGGLEIVEVHPEEHRLFVKGALPGPNGGIIFLYSESTGPGTEVKQEIKDTAPETTTNAPEVESQEKTQAQPEEEKKETSPEAK